MIKLKPTIIIVILGLFLMCEATMAEEAVIVDIPLSNDHMGTEKEIKIIFELENKLKRTIIEAKVGELDGNEIGQGKCLLYMYGPDAEKLFTVIKPILQNSKLLNGSEAIIRFGPPGSNQEIVKL